MSSFTYDNLIQVNSNGITKANYAEIVDAFLSRYKIIYGNDIDLDPRSGDGRFLYDFATIVNNGIQCISKMYSYLDPSIATGKFLDILCSLSNVQRKSATKSKAKVLVTNTSTTNDKVFTKTNPLALLDDAGNIWNCTTTSLTIPKNTSLYLVFECETTGRIITSNLKLVQLDSSISISISSINLGTEEEDDNTLRNRRASYLTHSISVSDGLVNKLTQINGVEDAYIYTNNTNIAQQSDNGVSIPKGSSYIIVRTNEILRSDELDTSIGTKIEENMTLGASTVEGNKSYTSSTHELFPVTYYWQEAEPVYPTITITLHLINNFAGESTCEAIAKSLVTYLENQQINRYTPLYEVVSVINSSDPMYQSANTFYCTTNDVSGLGSGNADRPNKDTYYYYGVKYSIQYESTGTDSWTFKIGVF